MRMTPIDRAAGFGRFGDTMLAHISPEEARILKMLGGSGTRNPVTGLPEFFGENGGGDDSSGLDGSFGGDMGGGFGDSYGADSFGGGDMGSENADRDAGMGMADNANSLDGYGGGYADFGDGAMPGGGFHQGGMMGETTEEMDARGAWTETESKGGQGFLENPLGWIDQRKGALIGGLLGYMSPIPGGMTLGRLAGSYIDEYGAPTMEQINAAGVALNSDPSGLGGYGSDSPSAAAMSSPSIAASAQSPSIAATQYSSPNMTYLSGQLMDQWKRARERQAARGMNPGSPAAEAQRGQWRDWYDTTMGQIRGR